MGNYEVIEMVLYKSAVGLLLYFYRYYLLPRSQHFRKALLYRGQRYVIVYLGVDILLGDV